MSRRRRIDSRNQSAASGEPAGGEGLDAAGEALEFAEKHGYFSQIGRFSSNKRLRRSLMLAAVSPAHFRQHRIYLEMAFEPLADATSRSEAIRQDPALYAALSIAATSDAPVHVREEHLHYLLEPDSLNTVDRRVLALHLLNPGMSFAPRDLASADPALSSRESADSQTRLLDSGLLSSAGSGRGARGSVETCFDQGA